jgi:nucleoside-diphosphate-sugar epimerase
MRKTVLITGATGFIGREVSHAFESANWIVHSVSTTSLPKANAYTIELSAPDALTRLSKICVCPDIVVHLAAVIPGVKQGDHSGVNEKMVTTVARWSVDAGAKGFILASSSAVYGMTTQPTAESTLPSPTDWYARSKLASEQIVESLPCRVVTLRISAPYGTHQPTVTVMHRFLHSAIQGSPICIWGSGKRSQHFCAVKDVAQGFIKAANSTARGIYNLSGPDVVSMIDLARVVKRVTNSNSEIRFAGEDPQDAFRACFPHDKATSDFGYSPNVTIEAGLRELAGYISES